MDSTMINIQLKNSITEEDYDTVVSKELISKMTVS